MSCKLIVRSRKTLSLVRGDVSTLSPGCVQALLHDPLGFQREVRPVLVPFSRLNLRREVAEQIALLRRRVAVAVFRNRPPADALSISENSIARLTSVLARLRWEGTDGGAERTKQNLE
jgi:hypothetical protein